jgi:hypothetical protein
LIESGEINNGIVVPEHEVMCRVPVAFGALGVVPKFLPVLDFPAVSVVVAFDEPVENRAAICLDVHDDQFGIRPRRYAVVYLT